MKLYCVSWWDHNLCGTQLSWHGSRTAAEAYRKNSIAEYHAGGTSAGDIPDHTIEQIIIQRGKSYMVAWLNLRLCTDNG